jgi:hypothetical protein
MMTALSARILMAAGLAAKLKENVGAVQLRDQPVADQHCTAF